MEYDDGRLYLVSVHGSEVSADFEKSRLIDRIRHRLQITSHDGETFYAMAMNDAVDGNVYVEPIEVKPIDGSEGPHQNTSYSDSGVKCKANR